VGTSLHTAHSHLQSICDPLSQGFNSSHCYFNFPSGNVFKYRARSTSINLRSTISMISSHLSLRQRLFPRRKIFSLWECIYRPGTVNFNQFAIHYLNDFIALFPEGTSLNTVHGQLQSICDPLGSLVADDKNWKTLLLLAAIQDITVRATWISTKANAITDALLRIDSIDLTRFTSHSIRRGGTQTAADSGLNMEQLQFLGRWKSNGVLSYVKPETAQRLPADSRASERSKAPRLRR
jgi:hypothetical protein